MKTRIPITLSPAQRSAVRSAARAVIATQHYPAHIATGARRIELRTVFSLVRFRADVFAGNVTEAVRSIERDAESRRA